MGFQFRVGKVWLDHHRRVCHVIGLLEHGIILPPVVANVHEHPGDSIQIDSMALGGAMSNGQLTLVASHITMEPLLLEGCLLTDCGSGGTPEEAPQPE